MSSPKSPPRRPDRLSIAQMMMLVGVLAFGLATARSLGAGLAALNVAVLALLVRLVLAERRGRTCPECGKPGMGRVAIRPFGASYYRCSACGHRSKRTFPGPTGSDPRRG